MYETVNEFIDRCFRDKAPVIRISKENRRKASIGRRLKLCLRYHPMWFWENIWYSIEDFFCSD